MLFKFLFISAFLCRDYGNLSRQQKTYNYSHSVTRVIIENVFGMLKGRWRILLYVNVYSIKKAIKIISACCFLHNFCLINTDVIEPELCLHSTLENENQVYIGQRENDGQTKRNYISTLI